MGRFGCFIAALAVFMCGTAVAQSAAPPDEPVAAPEKTAVAPPTKDYWLPAFEIAGFDFRLNR